MGMDINLAMYSKTTGSILNDGSSLLEQKRLYALCSSSHSRDIRNPD